jgi:hypothetical protein
MPNDPTITPEGVEKLVEELRPPMDFRTPEARKWPDTFIPPETCAAIDDVQNALEHLRDANSQLRHAAHLWRHVAEDELRRRVRLGQAVDAVQSLAEQRGVALGPFTPKRAHPIASAPPHMKALDLRCCKTIRLAATDTYERQRQIARCLRKQVPYDTCLQRVCWMVDGQPYCHHHAGREALEILSRQERLL